MAQIIYFDDAVINVADVSHALKTKNWASGWDDTTTESTEVHFISGKKTVLLFGVPLSTFSYHLRQATIDESSSVG